MFDPSRDQVRDFFFATWKKYREQMPIAGAEALGLEIILLHPEYHDFLGDTDKNKTREFSSESNPFLHMSLHLALEEQLQIDQPPGVRQSFNALLENSGDRHQALHEAIECLAEMVWRAQKDKTPPDAGFYLDCLRKRAG